MSLKRVLHFRRNRRTSIRNSPESLKKSAIILLRLFVPSLISFIAGICVSRMIGAPLQVLYERTLLSFFDSPFYGVKKPLEYLFRILFFSFPSFIKAALLTLSLATKKRPRNVCILLCLIQFLGGLYFPILQSLYETGRLTAFPTLLIRMYESVELSLSALFFIYAYRLTRCFLYGFPSKTAPPHAILRFLSYTIRLLIGIIFLVALRAMVVTIWI